jgi:hypothetical protein
VEIAFSGFNFRKELRSTAPINAKYRVLFRGFELMAHVPVRQPTYFQ